MEATAASRAGGGFLIRDLCKSDLDDLLDLLPKCFAKEFEIMGFDAEHARAIFNRAFGPSGRLLLGSLGLLGKDPMKFLVAEADSQVVGTTFVQRGEKSGYISSVMVHPDYRKRGIATALVETAVEYVQKGRMERAVLHVVSTNTPAIGVYSRLGFERFESITNLLGETDFALAQGRADDIEVRPYRGSDLDDVYDLARASEDPAHLRLFGLSRKDLKMPLWVRLSRFSTQTRLVALRAGRIVGFVMSSYTTPREAGSIGYMHVKPEDRSRGVERALIAAAVVEFKAAGVGRAHTMVPSTRQELVEEFRGLGFRETMTLVGMCREVRR
jgi:ribosomal protein S18 acetylase RimI-like enzyme